MYMAFFHKILQKKIKKSEIITNKLFSTKKRLKKRSEIEERRINFVVL
jgi:hypothetical protein